MRNSLVFFRRLIYALQKDYGFKVDLYRPVETVNPKTGRKITVRTKFKIKQAILFPSDSFRDYKYASLLSLLNPQTFDGINDVSSRRIMIAKNKLPKNFQIDILDYIVFNGVRYGIKNIEEMELIDYWQLIVKKIVGEPAYEIKEVFLKDELPLIEAIDGVTLNEVVPERLAAPMPL